MVSLRHALLPVVLSALAWNACAEVTHPAATPPVAIVSAGSLLQVGAALMLVLVVIAAVAWLVKRLNPNQTAFGGVVRVVGTTAVGQRERVVLVEVDNTWLLVGVAPGHVTALHSMAKPLIPVTTVPNPSLSDNTFAGWLKQTIERRRNA